MNIENLNYVNYHFCKTSMFDHKTATLPYQPIGELFWVKLANGDIVRLRCESIEMTADTKMLIHHYKAANGLKYKGSAFGLLNDKGYHVAYIYNNYEDCFSNKKPYELNGSWYGVQAYNLDLYNLIISEYGSLDCVGFEGCWNDMICINAFINRNGKIVRKRVPFALWIDDDGAHFNVKEFDNGTAFPTFNEALNTYKPKVIDFDDDVA